LNAAVQTVSSPCVAVCRLDASSGLCVGCARSSAEIAQWVRMSEHERLAVMAQLSGRFVQWPALQAARSALDEVAVPPGSCHRPDMP